MILVTGGTGLVGSHLLYYLAQKHDSIRATYRSQHKLDAVKHVFSYYSDNPDSLFSKIEWIEATLNDIPRLTEAFSNITYVYHCAALVSLDPNDYRQLRRTNINGTANIVNICVAKGVKRICYVSSVAAVGNSDNEPEITENAPWNSEADHSVYAITKYGAELEVWRGSQEGIDVVIVNPGIIIGPGFWRWGSGSLIKIIYKGLNYYTHGVNGYVDIHDVVRSMITLMESTIKNERYILVSENLSFKTFTEKVAAQLGVNAPEKEAKNWLLQLAWRMDWLKYAVQGKRRKLTKNTVKSITSNQFYNCDKIKSELQFKFTSMDDSIARSSHLFLKDQAS